MTVIVPHNMTQEQAIAKVDRHASELFALEGPVTMTDQTKSWNGPKMDFSMTASLGFISLPISGNAVVDATNVTIEVELPAMAKNFIGEEKIRENVEKRVRGVLAG